MHGCSPQKQEVPPTFSEYRCVVAAYYSLSQILRNILVVLICIFPLSFVTKCPFSLKKKAQNISCPIFFSKKHIFLSLLLCAFCPEKSRKMSPICLSPSLILSRRSPPRKEKKIAHNEVNERIVGTCLGTLQEHCVTA